MTRRMWLLLAGLCLSAPALAETRVVMLGTGTPFADPERMGPAVAVVVDDVPYLVDAGVGVVRQAEAARRAGVAGLTMPNLARVFISHLHADHTLGLPDLLLSPWVLRRTDPLVVHGPEGIDAMLGHITLAWREDVRMRLHGLQPANPTGYRFSAQPLEAGVVFEDARVRVTAFPVQHETWEHAFGFRFETADRVVVISGDTRPTEAIVQQCDGCDVLVHEVYGAAALARRTPGWRAYHENSHTSAVQLGRLAARARPELLVLYHQLYFGDDDAILLEEVRQHFDGNVVSAHDLDVF